MMDRLTRYVTTERPSGPLDESLPQLITVLAQLPQAITMKIAQPQNNDPPEQLIEEMITCYIVMYYYTALTNFWAQAYLPDPSEFEEKNEFQRLTRRTVDGSCQDFAHIAQLLGQVDHQRLGHNSLAPLLVETRDQWRHHVRSVADVLLQRGKHGA